MPFTLPERIKKKVKVNYVVRKCRRLNICDVSVEEIESSGYDPELLDKVVNVLYLKQLGREPDHEIEKENGKIHYATHATNYPKEIIEAGEIKSPLALVTDGMKIERVKERTIWEIPRAEICFSIDDIGYYGRYVFALPLEDLMKQEVKMGFDYEGNGGCTIHVTHKDFNEEEFLKNIGIGWGIRVGGLWRDGEKEFEKISKLKEKIENARDRPREFLLEILIRGIPNLSYPAYEEFNSPFAQEVLKPLERIIKECTVYRGIAKLPHYLEIPKNYRNKKRYIVISALERDETGEIATRDDGFYSEYIIFDKGKLLSKLEKIDGETLKKVLQSYIKQILEKEEETNRAFYDEIREKFKAWKAKPLLFSDYFSSIINEEYSMENMNADDFLEALLKTKKKMERDRENYFKKSEHGRVKLTENTVFIAPEEEKERWERFVKETGRKLKRFYYRNTPREFFDVMEQNFDNRDFIEYLKREIRKGEAEIRAKGLHKVCLALMAKKSGYITDFASGFGKPMYEFDQKLLKYFSRV